MTNEELLDKRNIIKNGAYSYTVYKAKNKNPRQERYCAVCGRKLVEKVNVVNPYYYTLAKHYYLNVLNVFRISMCFDARSCRKNLREQGIFEQ